MNTTKSIEQGEALRRWKLLAKKRAKLLKAEKAANADLRHLMRSAVIYPPRIEDGMLWYGFVPEFNSRFHLAAKG